MKIRSGFVSNSSSSSFIISDKNFPTVRSLAKYMLMQEIKEYKYNEYDWSKDAIKIDKQRIKKLNNVDENHPISFPSCNYDTYIKKIGDCYLVATCNNTDWNLFDFTTRLSENTKILLNNLKNTYPKKSRDYEEIQDILNGNNEFYHIDIDYYNLSNEIIGVETYDRCSNHNEFGNYLWDTKKYGKICLACHMEKIKRKEKLDKINIASKTNE